METILRDLPRDVRCKAEVYSISEDGEYPDTVTHTFYGGKVALTSQQRALMGIDLVVREVFYCQSGSPLKEGDKLVINSITYGVNYVQDRTYSGILCTAAYLTVGE